MPAPPYSNQELQLLLTGFDSADQSALQPVLALVYGFYTDRAAIYPRLRYWYARRHLVDHLLTAVYQLDELREGDVMEKRGEISANLQAIRAEADAEIRRLEAMARANRTPQIGTMATTAPEAVIPNAPDPNDPAYRGDPQRVTYNPQ